MRTILKVSVVLTFLALGAHGGYSVGRFREALVVPWQEALSSHEARRAYEISREAWYSSERLELSRCETEFACAIVEFYEAAIDIYASEEAELQSQSTKADLAALQKRFERVEVPTGVRWYVQKSKLELGLAGVVLVGSVCGLALLPSRRSSRGRYER